MTLWVTTISAGFETHPGPDSDRARFLIAAHLAVPDFVLLDRARPRPEELVINACPDDITRLKQGTDKPALTALSPVARAYPNLRFRRNFQAVVRLAVLSRNEEDDGKLSAESHVFVLHNLFTTSVMVNNR